MVRCLEIAGRPDRTMMTEKHSPLAIPEHNGGGSRMDSDPCEDNQSDSGVSADFSTSSTFDNVNANETPIEREIRRAVQREQSLRRSRGLKNLSPATEYVEIAMKPVLYPNLPGKSEQSQGKDRQIAGKKMLREIHAEVQREQDLVALGTVPGVYDKGTVRQLKERQKLFEVFQEPRDTSGNLAPRTRVPPWASVNSPSPWENQDKVPTPVTAPGGLSSGRGPSVDLPNQNQRQQQPQQQQQQQSPAYTPWNKPGGPTSSTCPRGPGPTEGSSFQVIIVERSAPPLNRYPEQPLQQNHRRATDATERESEEEEEEEEEEPLPKENPFFKLRSSTSVDKVGQDIRQARERERELRRQRASLYGAARSRSGEKSRGEKAVNGGGGGQPAPSCVVSTPAAPPAQPVLLTRRPTGTPAARQSLGKLGVWPPPSQAEEEQVGQLESPRASRQKTPLLQQWEAGLINMGNHDEDH